MKMNTVLGLVGLAFIWVPAVFSMGIPQEIQEYCELQDDPVLPTMLVHGFNNDASSMADTEKIVNTYCPGTYTQKAELGCKGYWSLEIQAEKLAKEMNSEGKFKKDCNIIAYSQGTLVARYALEKGLIKPLVHSLILLAGPQLGVCGAPGEWDDNIDKKLKKYIKIEPLNFLEKEAYKFFHNNNVLPQLPLSVLEMWHEPTQEEEYLDHNRVLPYLNGEVEHEYRDAYADNLGKTKIIASFSAENETVVEPKESTKWEYWDKKRSRILKLEELKVYDGLKINELGNHQFQRFPPVPGATHSNIHKNKALFVSTIMPLLAKRSDINPDAGKNNYEETGTSRWSCCCR